MPWARSLPFVPYTDEEGQFHDRGARRTYFIGGAPEARSGSERAPRDRISELLNEGTVPPAMTMTTPDRELVVERADAQPADTRVLITTDDVPPRFVEWVER